ncbi:hypothetical protein [Helicobacter rodentium]|nr:hypothetical protein [Helicobacter rodentium]
MQHYRLLRLSLCLFLAMTEGRTQWFISVLARFRLWNRGNL